MGRKLKCFDVSQAMDYVFTILKYTGHFPFENETRPNFLCLFIYYNLYISMILVESIYLVIVFGDIDKMAETMYLYITHMGIFYKAYNMYRRYTAIGKMVKELTGDPGQINSRRQKIIKEANKNFGTLITGYYIFGTCAWFMMVTSPLAQEGIAFPLGCWYPFDQTKPGWYHLAYAHQTAGIFFVAGVTLALDCVLIFLMQQLGMQLDLLREEFLYLNEAVENVAGGFSGRLETNENKIRDKLLARAVGHHQDLIRHTEEINEMFNVYILVQFTVSIIITCFSLIQLAKVVAESVTKFAAIFLYFCCVMFQIFLPCYYGNEMILKSTALIEAIYESNWADCPIQHKKKLIFIMMRCKNGLTIYGGNIFPMSLDSFVSILRTSYSYFAVLNTRRTQME